MTPPTAAPSAIRTSTSLAVTRSTAIGSGGGVGGKMAAAVEAGTAILARGGNAIDAAVATAFAAGVVEPWMSGLGGGGYLVGWLAQERRAFSIEYPMVSPSGASPAMYPLAGGVDAGLFGWPRTKDSANVVGYRSIAIPGTVAGLAMAVERFGTMSLAQVLEPAIALAEAEIPVTWHTTLMIAKDLANLRRFQATAAIYLDGNGCPPATIEQATPATIRNPDLAETLRAIADDGPRTFYEGEIGRAMVNHLAREGTPLSAADFAAYQAVLAEPTDAAFCGHTVHTVGKGTGGTSLAQALGILERLDLPASDHNSPEALHKLTHAFRQAFADRFTYLADPEHAEVPVEALLSDAYLDSRAARFDPDRVAPTEAGSREQLNVTHALEASVGEYMRDGSTTHLGVIDAEGNAVSLTQTLLSGWGSRVTVPGTGVLLNNGMMWFDPEPGRPNSIAPGKRPLANMAPSLVTRDGTIVASIGSSGGRKIMNCNAQIVANVAAWKLPIGDALAAPRIDASLRPLVISVRHDVETREEMERLGHPVRVADESRLTGDFASPVALARTGANEVEVAVDAWYYPATGMALE